MPALYGTPALGSSGDGRAELFILGTDGAFWHIWQTAANDGWSSWSSMGSAGAGDPTYPPAVAASGDGRLEVFVATADPAALQHIWQTNWSNGWSAWGTQGAPPDRGGFYAPGVAANADGRLMLFVADGNLWRLEQSAWSNGWSAWQSHGAPGGALVDGPVEAIRSGDGRIEVFVVDASGALSNIRQEAPNGAWSGWNAFDAPPAGLDDRPGLARSADGRIELFVRGRDNVLWHRWQLSVATGAAWSPWTSAGSAGGGFLDHPDIAPSADGRLELFITGLDRNIWHIWQTRASNGWSPWTSHGSAGGGFAFAPALGKSSDGRLELFAVGEDGNLWHSWQTASSNGWSPWTSHGHPT
jgi:hypothetical protein